MNSKLYSDYQNSNPERFNKDLICNKIYEDLLSSVSDALKVVEIIPGVTVENIRLETQENNFTMMKNEGDGTKQVLQSRFNKILFEVYYETDKDRRGELVLDDNGKPIKVKRPITFYTEKDGHNGVQFKEARKAIYIPKLIDNTFFINNDKRYYPIYQIVSKCTHPVKNGVSIRSLSMAISINKVSPITYKTVDGTDVTFETIVFRGFHRAINPIIYYAALLGMCDPTGGPSALQYFDADNVMRVFTQDSEIAAAREGWTLFKASKGVFFEVRSDVLNIPYYNIVAGMALGALVSARYEEDVMIKEAWVKLLGRSFTTNTLNLVAKAESALSSFSRLVDDSSRKFLYINDEDKTDTMALLRWMIRNYDTLHAMDDSDLENKRVRVLEYMIYPLRMYMSKQVFRVINTPRVTDAVVKRMFNNIGVMDVAKMMIMNDLLRYYNATNEINLYNAHLKYTFRGLASLTKRTSNTMRDVQPSYLGRISLVASSAGDPGMTGTLTPFAKLYDSGMFTTNPPSKSWTPDPCINQKPDTQE